MTVTDWASSAVVAASPAPNHATRLGALADLPHRGEDRLDRVVGGQQRHDPAGLAVDVGDVQLVAVGEVAVEGGPRAAGGPGDVAHRDGADAVLGEELAGGVEDPLGGDPRRSSASQLMAPSAGR